MLQTTAATLQQHRRSIPWAPLPDTFKEAIMFTYRLGIRYLWIDSLCIIQDSPEDWRHEGSQMSDIYRSTWLTLAATVAPNASAGLFRTSQPESAFRSLSYKSLCGKVYDIHCRQPLIHDWSDFKRSVLMVRAWAFQERMLSPRILHFMDEELWFECCEAFACECSTVQQPAPYTDAVELKPDLDVFLRDCRDPQELQWNWEVLVQDYSQRVPNLTYPNDVFPALQGLAKIVSPSMGAYLAGHWERCLDQSLSWHLPRTGTECRSAEWRAPSWSWASANSRVVWQPRSYGPKLAFITIVRSDTVSKGSDSTGQLVSGTIVVRGRCLKGRVVYGDQHAGYQNQSVIFEDDQECINTRNGPLNWALWDYRIQQSGPHGVADGTNILALKLDRLAGGSWRRRTWMILRLLREKDNIYERIGLLVPDVWASEQGDRLDALHQQDPQEMELTIC